MRPGKSLSTKLILLVEVILLLSSAVFCAISISRSRIGIRKAIQQRMVDIANCASGSVNGDILKTLYPGDEGTPEYKTIYDAIAVFRDNVELEYIYGVRVEGDGRFTFTVDVALDDPAAFGEEVQYTEALARAAEGTTTVDEIPYTDKWGEFYSAYSPVFDSDGEVAGIVAADFSVAWFDAQLREQTMDTVRSYVIILLITLGGAALLCLATVRPFVRYQEQLLEEKVKAESANQAKSDFLANMSHEIRTPINAVLGMNEMILRESRQGRDAPDEQAEVKRKAFDQIGFYAHEVESAGHSLLTIINGILDFSRIESGKMELVKVRYKLSTVLNDIGSIILFKAHEKGLEFILDADATLPDSLFGDEVRVREIITNILNNAVKYTERGHVRLTVCAGEQVGSTVRLVFTIEDTGIGIRSEDMDKLFNKFERMDMERNSTVEGSGLGLAITRSLLEMMGGTISVESEYGKGSVFTVMIPQRIVTDDTVGELSAQPEKRTAEVPVYRETFHAPRARLLIVDDTKMNLTVTACLLKSTKMKIDTASSGAEAVSLAESRKYDIIFMDQRMPGMDGTEALKRIRQMKGNPNSRIPVICLTADAIVGAKERYLSEGFTDYLSKPVDSRTLEAILLRYLPRDKVTVVSGAETEEQGNGPAARPGDGEAFALLGEAGIDPEAGLRFCQGDEDLYRTMLAEYAREYPEKAKTISGLRLAQNWKDYGILIHSLKSGSRMIGADDLSAMAARLETAANAGDTDTIRQEHEPLMTRYEEVNRAIRTIVAPQETGKEPEILEFAPAEEEPEQNGERQ